jgi:hypothetical protein
MKRLAGVLAAGALFVTGSAKGADTPSPAATAAAVAPTPAAAVTAVPMPTNAVTTTTTSTTTTTTTTTVADKPERAPGLGAPILFQGECEPRGGCHIISAGMITEAGLQPIPCDADHDGETRTKIVSRYFGAGTELDLYARGAAAGSFIIVNDESAAKGCTVRAGGKRRGTPVTVMNFVALLPDDPVKLAALRFPGEPQPSAKAIAELGFAAGGATAGGPIDVNVVRRFREGGMSVMVVDADTPTKHVLTIAEGAGADPTKWKAVWQQVSAGSESRAGLVDALDLGADGHAEILLEKTTSKGDAAPEWTLLRRTGGAWK